jgi:hypothetical protein
MVMRFGGLMLVLLACGRAAAAPAPDARAAVQRALPFLERDGAAWMAGKTAANQGSPCVSCHHVGMALWSHREAKRAGLPIPADRIDALDRQAHAAFAGGDEARPVSSSQLILGRDGPKAKSDLEQLTAAQEKDGRFAASGQFPSQERPIAESDAVATLWAMVALGKQAEPARKNAADWLKASKPGETTEWVAARLVADGRPEDRERLVREQHADGGWGWKAAGPSNAFSTGVALYALAIAAPQEPAVRRAAAYLVGTQSPDGTWAVPSKLISKKAHPKRDYIYRYWGTAWATIGLARLAGDTLAAGR